MDDGRYPVIPGPDDTVKMRATVTFTFDVWNTGDVRKSPEELARKSQSGYALMQDELADAVGRAHDLEVTVVPVEVRAQRD